MSESSQSSHLRLLKGVSRVGIGDVLGVPSAFDAECGNPFLVDCQQTLEMVRLMSHFMRHQGPILMSGPGGVGKQLAARLLHVLEGGSDRPMLTLDLSKLDEPQRAGPLLFGHYQSGRTAEGGYLERAQGGTLLLKGIECLPVGLEDALLQALMEGDFQRVGGGKRQLVACRVVVTARRVRGSRSSASPLMYALLGRHVALYPLAQRGNDAIERLCYHFIRYGASRAKRTAPRLTPEALHALQAYGWPGNILELKQAMIASALIAQPAIEPQHLPESIIATAHVASSLAVAGLSKGEAALLEAFADQPTLEQMEARYIAYLLDQHAQNRSAIARVLGIGRNTLIAKIRQYRLG